jgi:asparagine synthase (glutamine-hydrolysing)
MCGIVGKVRFDGAPIDARWLSTACDLQTHRGPDGAAHAFDGGGAQASVALGHRRLKVIDLRPVADQPMRNSGCVAAGRARSLTLVFNGEIYNYRELRRQLESNGHRFTSDSDTEVILHLYEEHGTRCVESLRGMFAFALWDSDRQRMMLARDRVGKKPLYYRLANSTLWFASEPRSILADQDVPLQRNPAAIHAYLRYGYVPSPDSAFDGLHRIPAGHVGVVDAKGLRLERYWQLTYEPKTSVNAPDAVARITARLDESVRMRLVSDVPLGAFLSGGIDSSAIVAMMSRHAAGRIKTFSIGFDDPRYNELQYARIVARRYQTEHHEFVVKPELETVLPKLAWHYGEPFADSSAVPTFHLARLARQQITVALNGDGGDESFAGYRRYVAHRAMEKLGNVKLARAAAAAGLRLLPQPSNSRSKAYDVRRVLSGVRQSPAERYLSWFGFYDHPAEMFDPEFAQAAGAHPAARLEQLFNENRHLDPADAAMAADVALYLTDDLLVKVDIATMAQGLEARSPLLDHVLMEEAARLPLSVKLPGWSTKPLLRQVLRGAVPNEILDRRKMGFGIPLDRWLREDLRQMTRDTLLSSRAAQRGYFRPGAVERVLEEHDSGRRSHAHRIWALLMLELWEVASVEAARASRAHVVDAAAS